MKFQPYTCCPIFSNHVYVQRTVSAMSEHDPEFEGIDDNDGVDPWFSDPNMEWHPDDLKKATEAYQVEMYVIHIFTTSTLYYVLLYIIGMH